MSKRKGRKPLNYDNPDEDSEPEEAGTMTLADEAEIRSRVMKVAKRRLVKQQPEGGVFNSLNAAACLKSQPSINLESTFAFLKNNTGATSAPSLGAIASNSNLDPLNGKFSSNSGIINRLNNASAQPKSDLSFKRAYVESPESSLKPSYSLPPVNSKIGPSPSAASGDNRRQLDMKELAEKDASNPILERVKILNIECLQWAQQHVDEDPCVDLRPVFKDYNQHFEAILEEFQKSEANKPKETNASSETLVKLQNHIKTKNQLESSKDIGKKSNDYCSSTNDIYSPDSNAEMKNKISQSLDRLSYFSSLLGNNPASNETTKAEVGTPTRVSVSTPTSNLDSSPKTQLPIAVSNPSPKADSGSTGLAFGRSSSGNFSFGTDAPKPTLSASPVTQASDNKSPASAGSFFKIPALEKNCFSNPSLMTKDSTESKEKSPFGSIAAPVGAFTLSSGSGSFGAPQQKTETEEEADDEDQPPVVEVKPIIEEGAKYTARCKVFIKKEDNSYADKGVGTLSLKCVDNAKYQLVIRAESTLGNILVNVLLSKDIPIQRTGKNNVLLVCLPTPESEPPPKVVLLRVKTGAEADELHQVLKNTQV